MVERLRHAQPDGPYRIAGYSLGGLVAFEMAQQLTAMGERVDLLAIWDMYPGAPTPQPLRSRLALHWQRLAREPFLGKARYVAVRLAGRFARLAGRRRWAEPPKAAGEISPWFEIHRRLWIACRQAARDYDPVPYAGRLVLCRSDRRADWEEFLLGDPYERWNRLARRGVIRHEIDAEHLKLLKEPYVAQLASIMARYLAVPAESTRGPG
jgi:acetoacetyl-CoA synthetase